MPALDLWGRTGEKSCTPSVFWGGAGQDSEAPIIHYYISTSPYMGTSDGEKTAGAKADEDNISQKSTVKIHCLLSNIRITDSIPCKTKEKSTIPSTTDIYKCVLRTSTAAE
jgi:hypothetical protein